MAILIQIIQMTSTPLHSLQEEFILTAEEMIPTKNRDQNLTEFDITSTFPLFHSPHSLLGLLSLGCIALQIIMGEIWNMIKTKWETNFPCRSPPPHLPLFWQGKILLPPSSYFFWTRTLYQVKQICSRFLSNLVFRFKYFLLHPAWRISKIFSPSMTCTALLGVGLERGSRLSSGLILTWAILHNRWLDIFDICQF